MFSFAKLFTAAKSTKVYALLKQIVLFIIAITLISSIIGFVRAPAIDISITSDYFGPETLQQLSPAESNRSYILHFWGTWCPVCRREAPFINELSSDLPIITVAVNSGDKQAINTFMQQNGYTYTVLNDEDGSIAALFNVQIFPTTFYIDEQKRIKYAEVGFSSHWGMKLRLWLCQWL